MNLGCVVLVVNEADFGKMVDIVNGRMKVGLGSPLTRKWADGRTFPMCLHFDESITYSHLDSIDDYNVISSSQFKEKWEKWVKLDSLELNVGDEVVLVSERPMTWNIDGDMDELLGTRQVIKSIRELNVWWCDELIVEFEDPATNLWCFKYSDISHKVVDEIDPMVIVIEYPTGKGIDWQLDKWYVIVPEEYEGIANAYAIEQFDKFHSNKKIYGIYEK